MSLKMNVSITNKLAPRFKKIREKLNRLPQEALEVFTENTAKKTGNARSKTRLRKNKTIIADYPYAQRLDNGWSQQKPDGMTKPTEEFIAERYQQIMRGQR